MKPQPDQFKTRSEYKWAAKQHRKQHGGSLIGTLAIAAFFGALTGSQVLFWALIAFAVLATVIARKGGGQ
jgi:hypothetical protein